MKSRRREPGSGRCRPRCEALEGRVVLSSDMGFEPPMMFDAAAEDSLRPVSVEPGGGAVLNSVDRVVVSFDRPIDEFSLGFDVRVDRLGDTSGPPSHPLLSQLAPEDPSRLVVNLDTPLAAGRYQVVLVADSFLMGQSFEPLAGFGQDQVLGTFEVAGAAAAPSRDNAIDLGKLGASERAVTGRIDPDSSPVAVYKVELTADHTWWRLGLQVDSRRVGDGLSSSLAIFDAAGNLVARSGQMGRPDAKEDAYMFAGLAPGTYYVGVSDAGNRAGQPDAYDLSGARSGPSGAGATAGAFTLRLAADPAEGPIQVLGFALDRADPLDPRPTGFRIQFTGALRVEGDGGSLRQTIGGGLEVVDEGGRVTPLVAVKYDEAQAAVTYVFERELPAGVYSVRVASLGGLTDLAGHTPLRVGLPAGVLARFDVPKTDVTRDPLDFGPQYPDAIRDGHLETFTLAPGMEIGLRFVTLFDGAAQTFLTYDGGPLNVDLVNLTTGAVERPLDLGPPGSTRMNLDYLARGPHLLRLKAAGDAPVTLTVGLQFGGFAYESLLMNGVGQGPALGLRVVSPVAVLGLDAVPGPAMTGTPSSPGSSSHGGPETAAVNPIAAVIGLQLGPAITGLDTSPVLVPGGGSTVMTMATPGGLALSVGGVPVGLPGTGLTATAAVGSSGLTMAQAQAVSVAIAGPGAGQGAGTLSPETGLAVSWSLTPDTEGGSASAVDAARLAEPDPDPELSGFWGRLESLARLLVSDREDASPRPSATAAAAPARPVPQDAPAVEVASLAPNGWTRAIARSEAAVDGDDPDVARPDAVAILSVLILTVLPFRDRLARWVGRGGSRANPARRSTRPARSRPRTAPGTPGTRLAV